MTSDQTNRIDRVETEQQELRSEVSNITAVVGKLEVGLSNVGQMVSQMASSVQAIASRQAERTPTNWGWVLAALGLLGAVIVLYTGPIEKRQERMHAEVSENRRAIAEIRSEQACAAESARWIEKDHDRGASP